MKLSLKNLREKAGVSLNYLSRLTGIKVTDLKDFEEYKEIPKSYEVAIILDAIDINTIILGDIFTDIIDNYSISVQNKN